MDSHQGALSVATICRCRATSLPGRHGQRLRPHRLGRARDRLDVLPVGLCRPAGGAGKVALLARVDDDRRQTGSAQRRSNAPLEAAGGLERDQRRDGPGEPLDQGCEGVSVPTGREDLTSGMHMYVEPALGDIDPDEYRLR